MPSSLLKLLSSLSLSFAALLCGCSPVLDSGSAESALADGVLDPLLARPAEHEKLNSAQPLGRGGMVVSKDGRAALISDVDGNRLLHVDLANGSVKTVALDGPGAIPGHPVVDDNGTFFVPLLDQGRVHSVQADGRRGPWAAVCVQPRSVAVQPGGKLVVACANGDLLRLRASRSEIVLESIMRLPVDDLQDVQLIGREIWVSTLLRGEIVRLGLDLKLLDVVHHPGWSSSTSPPVPYQPRVQWRMVPFGAERALLALQQHQALTAGMGLPYYGAPLPILPFVSQLGSAGQLEVSVQAKDATLATDLAVRGDGSEIILMAAGNIPHSGVPAQQLPVSRRAPLFLASITGSTPRLGGFRPVVITQPNGAALYPNAVAAYGDKDYVVHARNPNALYFLNVNGIITRTIALPAGPQSAQETARDDFHAGNPRGLACASCHVEARHDGNIWTTPSGEMLRTQSLEGTLQNRSRFRWTGAADGLTALVADDMQRFGSPLSASATHELTQWLLSLRSPWNPAVWSSERQAAARGEAIFARQQCGSCHSGPQYTAGIVVMLSGKQLLIPSLKNVATRAPFGHDGRASSLQALFDDAGDQYHHIAAHTERDDLAQFLNRL